MNNNDISNPGVSDRVLCSVCEGTGEVERIKWYYNSDIHSWEPEGTGKYDHCPVCNPQDPPEPDESLL